MTQIDTTPLPKTILIIDDEPYNLHMMVDHLETQGYRILVSQDGESGLKRAKYAQPDLILLDVIFPDMDGFTVCHHLKSDEATKDIPVIFMTILTIPEDKVRAFTAGGVDYVTKPVQWEELLARVDAHLRIRELTQQLARAQAELARAQAELKKRAKNDS